MPVRNYREWVYECGCSEATRQNEKQRLAENCCPIFWGALVSPEHFSAEFAVLLIMSRLKADKLIHQRASDSWHFVIWSTGHLRGGPHLFKAADEQNTAQIPSSKPRLWNVLMKMSHFLLSLLISLRKLISNKGLISHWHSAFAQAADTYFDVGLPYLMDAENGSRHRGVALCFCTTMTTPTLFIQLSKQRFKQTSACFISISEIRSFI